MRNYSGIVLSLLLLLAGGIGSCSGRKDDNKTDGDPGRLYQHQFIRKLETINPGLRDPSTLIQILESTGAGFITGLVNESGMDAVYLADSALSAINLGIYTVDLVYLLAYEQDEQADEFIVKARTLADKIGAGHIYDHALYKRYRSAGVHPDTLLKYLSRAAEKMEHQYGKKELFRLYTLFATGEFIEKLHLSTSLLVNAEKSEVDYYWTVMVIVFQQERALEDLIMLLDQIRYQDEGDVFMARMNDLKLIYGELTDYNQMAGINTRNIAENRAFQDLVQQVGFIREMIVTPD